MNKLLVCAVLLLTISLCEAVLADDVSTVRVRMTTDLGAIEIVVHVNAAPVTAKNFLRLVDGGYLDGGTFYRTVSPQNDNGNPPISVIQGGVGQTEKPFPPIAHESTENTGLRHVDGAIAMARGGLGTATTEFFICIGDQPGLDFGDKRNADGQGFAAFGRVIAGMDVVRAIHNQPSDAPTESAYFMGQMIEEPVEIESVRRVAASEYRLEAASDTGR